MSICSDVFISREKAREMVKAKLMYQQEKLVEIAVKNMKDWELTSELNDGSEDLYFYNIERKEKKNGKSDP